VFARLAEIVGLFALGQDNAFGQPMGSQLRSCIIADRLAQELGVGPTDRAAGYWVALLRYVGCTGHAHEVAAVFGDDIGTRSRSVVKDLSDPRELLPEILGQVGSTSTGIHRLSAVLAMLAGGRKFVEMNFRTGCEVGDALLERLGMTADVRKALAHTFEQWNGKGFPRGVRGPDIPQPMRIVRFSHDLEALTRIRGLDEARAIVRRRAGKLYDPDVLAAFESVGKDLLSSVEAVDPWDAVLDLEPHPHRVLDGADLDAALLVVADFVDIKSPYTLGHSRGIAALAADAAASLGLPAVDIDCLRRAAWVHDLGRTAIPNSIWDKPSALTRAERDRVELHPVLTTQMLRRVPALEPVQAVAALHHERCDGSGYAKGLTQTALPLPARVLAVADRYHDLIEDRAYRPALSATQAAAEIRRRVADRHFDVVAAEAVLGAAGHATVRTAPPSRPAVLTDREVQVARLAAQGLTMRQVASRLGIAVKTVDAHIQNVYAKTGVSTRGALALYAVEQGLLPARE
jgi:HD-GYP domain-containing protein (c-di-GMP phosphodiesterase class II)